MKSPFPGMDPYLERRWGDVHTSLCVGIRSALQTKLPRGLRARAQEDVPLESTDDEASALFEPDISIVESVDRDDPRAAGLALAVKPIIVQLVRLPKRRRWVEILDTSDGNRLVTTIEILSPANKESGKSNLSYRKKHLQYLDGNVNVVDIDLLRSSRNRLLVPPDQMPDGKPSDYCACVCRAKNRQRWMVYPMPLRSSLPPVPIPCREIDADVALELQPIIDRIYVEGAHDDLDYSEPPEPPFSKADAKWAAKLTAKLRKQR